MSILTIVGGQYGSEGKGVIAHQFAQQMDVAVRTGGPNAGHSIIHEGRVWKMRSIPVNWTNPRTQLVLGPGAVIDQAVLLTEIDELEQFGYSIRSRLWIDPKATMIMSGDTDAETGPFTGESSLVERIGSTGKGIGAARIRRLDRDQVRWRTAYDTLPEQTAYIVPTGLIIQPYVDDPDKWVMLEGTQGFGLSVTHGPWPYVTSNDCTTAQLWNDAGIFPTSLSHTILVFRSYPIRVAGNSGPLKDEISWDTMSKKLGKVVEERTTVTNKVRRIGFFDWELAIEAVRVNRPQSLALTFADYIDPKVEGESNWNLIMLSKSVRAFKEKMEDTLEVEVALIGTGGPKWSVGFNPTGPISNRRDPREREDHNGTSVIDLLRGAVRP